ncbi:endoplasmic reticulum-Golgi intermediate compartment protein 2-like [Polyodon spathula]|uniref:endoplasmic reticulum-Golgi intermediate compartment protein 2-like n=1 Tax=Polyodon spathula TaxID=7913 RepID=UPI001B7E78D8|nr:endoplasmic reticulum-Golgi intermediate compartment protein 2-like [Polyodon spathula]
MRRRLSSRKSSQHLFKELDVFPKLPESCTEVSAAGGTVSLLTFTLIGVLSLWEFWYFQESWIKYDYEVDSDITSKLQINIDITVAAKCDLIGADALDVAKSMVTSSEHLQYKPDYYELTPEQQAWQRKTQSRQNRNQEHTILNSLLQSSFNDSLQRMPQREIKPADPPNACRIHGSIQVNKVAGNFHISLGKPLSVSEVHMHLSSKFSAEGANFSHRINHFSFGDPASGLVNPLDGSEKTTHTDTMFQYFLVVVPTKVKTYKFAINTHQYSVTEKDTTVNVSKEHQGIPGIFIRYDISSLTVKITEEGVAIGQFATRICGIVGGIFSTAGLLHKFCGFLIEVMLCQIPPEAQTQNTPPNSTGNKEDQQQSEEATESTE